MSPQIFEFDGFRFDTHSLVLYRDGQVLREAERHSLQVLAVILSKPDQLATYDEIIGSVWPEAHYGIDPSRVNQHISKLRRLLASYVPEVEYFENLRGRGYRFKRDLGPSETSEPIATKNIPTQRSRRRLWLIPAVSIVVIGLTAAAIWTASAEDDTKSIEKAVKDSQIFEAKVLYRNPEGFSETDLDRYWTAESDVNINYDRTRIRQAVAKLVTEDRRYGEETRCDRMEFQSVNVNENGDEATVRTLEKWFIAEQSSDGTLIKIKPVGPYFVDYILRNSAGRWLIEKSTTARMIRPTPVLDTVRYVSPATSEGEFLIDMTGNDIEPMTFHIEIVGRGCPDSQPCRIGNAALLERSKLSKTTIEAVPLTLASGTFQITARNGDSKPSNAVSITVP